MPRYIPKASSTLTAKIMRANRGKDTKMELKVRKALWHLGYRYRKNNRRLYGAPDISFPKQKIVIFLDSCFWHGCPLHFKLPIKNQEFWKQKIQRNVERDAEITNHYDEVDWIILRFWEHEVNSDFNYVITVIKYFVDNTKKQ
ncbi:very short patch repair endonuclease [Metabacillus indicus]|uniref:very short patch repair endonuclease n=1 Tax=Metabacillus indicus TaxID=246786 RepID=UPI002A016D5F|nr:very short patch repair endonuclease [Metabacillus indicus]MDX8289119.1 very short patch repair endonuclease [Metabacillus indicus]